LAVLPPTTWGEAQGLSAALLRNFYEGYGNPDRLARYVKVAVETLDKAAPEDFLAAKIAFPEPAAIP
jgi:hypothetical protein